MIRNIKLIIEYDGTNYCGWQKQNNAITIQQKLQEALQSITKQSTNVVGSSRTDTGVHARGFVANFFTETKIPDEKFKIALNSKLPKDIVILESKEVSLDFHARYSSKGKTYVYTILNRDNPIAIGTNYVYHFKKYLDIESMKKASKYFLGTYDFSAFRNKGSSVKTSIRTITQLNCIKNDDVIKVVITADGFLYNMVRIIVGTLIDIGLHKNEPEYIKEILLSKDRKKAGKTVPARGLYLKKVFY